MPNGHSHEWSVFNRCLGSCLISLALSGCTEQSNSGAGREVAATSIEQDQDPVLVGAGDIATCGFHLPWFNPYTDGDTTARILDSIFAANVRSNGIVFTVGDHAYPAGSPEDF